MTIIINILLTIVIFGSTLFSEDINIEYLKFHNKAIKSYYAKDYKGWLKFNKKALEFIPNHPRSIYYLSDAYALNGNKEKSIFYLSRAIEMGLGWNSDKDKNFNSLREYPDFKNIISRIKILKKPVNNSNIAFNIIEKDIIPEGLAYNKNEDCFYLSSLYKSKIIKIDKNGNTSDFTSEKQDGLRPVTGMKVDHKRNILWVCSEVSGLNYRNSDPKEMGWSGVFKYNLKTGKLIRKYTIFEKGKPHLFNDIIVLENGNVFITDSNTKEIFTINAQKDKLEVFFKYDGFGYLNGIALSNNQNSIYLADAGMGIAIFNIKNKTLKYLSTPENIATIGIDGLYFYKNNLIAIQNSLGSIARVSKFYLNKIGDKIIKSEIIELDNPHFAIPTTGAIKDNNFYYIANSQMTSFDKKHNILPMDKLKNVIILRTKLNLIGVKQ